MAVQKIGAFYQATGSEFIVWAPLKEQVELIIEKANPSRYPMQRDQWGYWKTTVPVACDAHYWYGWGKEQYPDPASTSQPTGVHQASQLISRNFIWNDYSWKGLPLEDMIIYEIHTGTFSEQHDFAGIQAKLDYLVSLGINTIELMPVAQCPGERNWGYDGVFPFAVQQSYGGAKALKELVNAAHTKGIAVLLDVVYNHIGPEGNYFHQYAPYFNNKYHSFWGDAINFDDAWCDGVRNYFVCNALMWLEEFHIDGLRLDAVHAIKDSSAHHIVQQLEEEVNACEKRTGCLKILIAELDLNDPRYISAVDKGGYNLDGQWVDEFHHALHALVTGETNGYYEDFGRLQHLAKAFNDVYVYDGIWSEHRKRIFGAPLYSNRLRRFVVFAQNHDQVGNRALGERLSVLISFEAVKVAAATVLLSPYVPLLFMGEEYGETNPFHFFTDHGDKDLIAGIREGRKKEFAHVEGEFADPQSIETFHQSTLSWNNSAEGKSLLQYYQYLLAFRKSRMAMKGRTRDTVKVTVLEEKVLAVERTYGSDQLYILFYYGKEAITINNHWNTSLVCIFNASSLRWKGVEPDVPFAWKPGRQLQIPSCTAMIFENKSN